MIYSEDIDKPLRTTSKAIASAADSVLAPVGGWEAADPNRYYDQTSVAPSNNAGALGNFFGGVVNAIIPGSNLGDSNNAFRSFGEEVGIPLVAAVALPAIIGAASGGIAAGAAQTAVEGSAQALLPAAVEAGGAAGAAGAAGAGAVGTVAGSGIAGAGAILGNVIKSPVVDTVTKVISDPQKTNNMGLLGDISGLIGNSSKLVAQIQDIAAPAKNPTTLLQSASANVQQPLQQAAQFLPGTDDPVTAAADRLIQSMKQKIAADPSGNQFATAPGSTMQIPIWVWIAGAAVALFLLLGKKRRS